MVTSVSNNLGVGSGLPLTQLLADLRANENQALTLIKNRYDASQNRVSAYATLRNAVENVKTAAQAVSKENTLGALKATTTGDAYTATASSKAIAGDYRIEVTDLASTQTLVSEGQTDRSAAISEGGVITFTFEGKDATTLDLKGKIVSMEDLVKAINADSKLGVRATLVNDGSNAPHRLLLTSTETGTDAAITSISVTGNTDPGNGLQSLIGYDAASQNTSPMTQQVAAQNAAIKVNGLEISSQSNSIKDAIEGVTLNLLEAGSTQTLKITRDDTAAATAIKGFVTAYNALQTTIGALTKFDIDNGTSSPLTGDSVARRVQSMVRDSLNVSQEEGTVRSLAQLGITTDPVSGALKVDDEKLNAALADNLPDIKNLLTGDNGLVKRVTSTINTITNSDGMITSATNGAERNSKLLDKEYTATTLRIEERMETYRQQFVALDKTVAQMSSVSSYLTQQLAMLSNLSSQSNSK